VGLARGGKNSVLEGVFAFVMKFFRISELFCAMGVDEPPKLGENLGLRFLQTHSLRMYQLNICSTKAPWNGFKVWTTGPRLTESSLRNQTKLGASWEI
jgi:hypothetical protein